MNWLSRALRWAPWVAVTVMVLAIVVWLAGPFLVSSIGASQLSKKLGRPVTMGKVRIEPWDIAVSIDDLQIGRAAGDAAPDPQLRIGHLRLNLDIRSLALGAPVIESLDVVDPALHLARTGRGRFDVDDVLERLAAVDPEERPDDGPPRLALFNLKLRGGSLDLDDRPVGRKHTVRDLEMALPFLSTLPADVDVTVQPRLAFTLDGTRLDSGAEARPFAIERSSTLKLDIGDVDLAQWSAYWPASWPVRVQRGVVSANVQVEFLRAPKGATHLGLRGTLRGRDLSLEDASGAGLLAWRAAEVVMADVRPLEQTIGLGRVRIDGPVVSVARDAAQRINWQQLGGHAAPAPSPQAPATPDPASAAASDAPASAPAGGRTPRGWTFALDRLDVNEGTIRWADAATRPAAAIDLQQLTIEADRMRWPLSAAVPWKLSARMESAGQAAGQLSLGGEIDPHAVKADIRIERLALAMLEPYLSRTLAARLEGQLDAQATWEMSDPLGTPAQTLRVASVVVDGARLAGGGSSRIPLPSLARLEIADADVDWAERKISVARVTADEPAVWLARDAQGRFSFAQWLAASGRPGQGQGQGTDGREPPLRVRVGEVALRDARIRWRDEAAPLAAGRSAQFGIDALNVTAREITWPAAAPMPLELALRVRGLADFMRDDRETGRSPARASKARDPRRDERAPGRIEWNGTLALQPLAVRGRLVADRLPLPVVEPYIHASVPIDLVRGEAGFRGTVDLQQPASGLQARVDGDALLTDLRIDSRATETLSGGEQLLAWQALKVPGIRWQWRDGAPMSLQTGESVLTDLYASLVVTEQGRLNLADVRARDEPVPAQDAASAANETRAPPPPDAVVLGPAASGSAPAAAASGALADAAAREQPSVQLALGGLQLVNGKVDFADHFVKPNYSAALTELNGRIGTFRSGSGDMAPIELRGRAAGTAQLEVRGAVNPAAKPLALDIQARASDLELAPLSPYAGKYVGYAIERGKLTMDVRYTIRPDGQLTAANQIVLNQLTFGEKVDSPNATSLPVKLAVALLKDSNGVIDLDLPISGSLNDPQFSFGGLIVKVLVNLLVKAVTAPFSLLTGGAAEGGSVEFVPGTAVLPPTAAQSIERIGQALKDRPSLQLTIAGAADPVSEREAIQQALLDQRIEAEVRKERVRAGRPVAEPASVPGAAPPAIGAEDRARALKEIYDDTKLPNKPRNLLGFAKSIPPAEMETLLRQAQLVSNDTARDLALKRGIAVREALLALAVPGDRIFLAAPRVRGSGEDDAKWAPRVELTLAPR